MSEEQYWEQIVHACFLDHADPIARWREVNAQITDYKDRLNALEIDRLHVQGDDVDLLVSMGESRQWVGGSGRNIPSFEIFTSPDWRGTEGWIYFNQPLYRYGNVVKGMRLEFQEGRVVDASAEQNEDVIREMIATENADKVGEFSLTDSRFSRITRFMAETLYDENVGGPFGNTHIALGNVLPRLLRRRSSDAQRVGVGAPRLQQLERSHRHRLDERPHRHGDAPRRDYARHLRGRALQPLSAEPRRSAGWTSWLVPVVFLHGRWATCPLRPGPFVVGL